MTNILGYTILAIIFFVSSFFSFQQKMTRNKIIESGKIRSAIIIKMPISCIESYRQTNYCEVIDESQNQYSLQLNYKDCRNLNIGDTVQIRQKDGIGEILRYNANATTINYVFEFSLLCFGILSLGAAIYNFKNQKD